MQELCGYHQWLRANRRLPDGTYWTTGLANGLDNSPSLGDGYPCLTAQMAHDAETLGKIARLLGYEEAAQEWEKEAVQIREALNAVLWNEEAGISSRPNYFHSEPLARPVQSHIGRSTNRQSVLFPGTLLVKSVSCKNALNCIGKASPVDRHVSLHVYPLAFFQYQGGFDGISAQVLC